MNVAAEANLDYEGELKRNPLSPTLWLSYLKESANSSSEFRIWLFQRSTNVLPRFYKLWKLYLHAITEIGDVEDPIGNASSFKSSRVVYERALTNLCKMPRLWIMYIEFLIANKRITETRRVVNRALQSLPVSQHSRIWDVVINKFIGSETLSVPTRTCKALLSRYLEYEPEYADAVISFLIDRGDVASAVELLIRRIQESQHDSSTRLLLLIELISKNSNDLRSLSEYDLAAIIRTGISRYPSRLGELWNSLSDYYIRLGQFSRAIDVYEEAIESVQTVVDFSVIFESYQNFLELVVQTKFAAPGTVAEIELEMDLQRLELLLARRPELLSSVVLRQNPHNVIEWIKRTRLPRIAESPEWTVRVFEEGIKSVDPESPELVGRVSSLWIEYAKWFIPQSDLASARTVFERAVRSEFKNVDDLATVWMEWVLMELRVTITADTPADDPTQYIQVLEIARRSVSQYRGAPKGSVQSSLFRSVKLWLLAVDIEQSVHGVTKPELVRGLYESMMELRVITPLAVINYAQFELDLGKTEKCMQILERAVTLFPWPHCREIWLFYLSLVTDGGAVRFSTERVRDLFEQAIGGCPVTSQAVFYFYYFKFELQRGLASSAIAILLRAAESVALNEKPGFWLLAVAETIKSSGAGAARPIFQRAIELLAQSPAGDLLAIDMCLRFASLEAKLSQPVRARKLYEHASQFAQPDQVEYLWEAWKNFEVEHGDEQSYKEMKRVRRAVQVKFSKKHFNTLDVGIEQVPQVVQEEVAKAEETKKRGPAGIDLSKLRAAAEKKQRLTDTGAGGIAEAGDADRGFIAASEFSGAKPGYVFTTGSLGVGYYRDNNVV